MASRCWRCTRRRHNSFQRSAISCQLNVVRPVCAGGPARVRPHWLGIMGKNPPMHQQLSERVNDLDPRETAEWIEALDQILDEVGPDRAAFLLEQLSNRAKWAGVDLPLRFSSDYVNTIPVKDEVPYP